MSSRILLVEDSPGLRLTIPDLLSTDGHEVFTEQDGEAGLALRDGEYAGVHDDFPAGQAEGIDRRIVHE